LNFPKTHFGIQLTHTVISYSSKNCFEHWINGVW